jgi:hypothetical protein
VRVDCQAQEPQPVLEVVLPERRLPLEQQFPTPDVVDDDVKPPALGIDPLYKRLDLTSLEMVDCDRDPYAPAAVTSSAVSSIVSGRSYSDRRSPVVRPVQ